MAKERLKSPRARLFVALDLPDDGAGRDRRLGGAGAGRPGAAAGAGASRSTSRSPSSASAGEGDRRVGGDRRRRCEAPAPRFELGARRPARAGGGARLFALDAPSRRRRSRCRPSSRSELVAARLYEPEKRPFWPHVTVARVQPREGVERSGRGAVQERPRGRCPSGPAEPFGAVRVTLYRSILRPQGARVHAAGASRAVPTDRAAVR